MDGLNLAQSLQDTTPVFLLSVLQVGLLSSIASRRVCSHKKTSLTVANALKYTVEMVTYFFGIDEIGSTNKQSFYQPHRERDKES